MKNLTPKQALEILAAACPLQAGNDAYTLAPNSVRALETFGMAPGGWDNFACLATGLDPFNFNLDHFTCDGGLPEDAHKLLFLGFTRKLSPPQAAANMALGWGVHPLILLEAASRVGSSKDGAGKKKVSEKAVQSVLKSFAQFEVAMIEFMNRGLEEVDINEFVDILVDCAPDEFPGPFGIRPSGEYEILAHDVVGELMNRVLIPAGLAGRSTH